MTSNKDIINIILSESRYQLANKLTEQSFILSLLLRPSTKFIAECATVYKNSALNYAHITLFIHHSPPTTTLEDGHTSQYKASVVVHRFTVTPRMLTFHRNKITVLVYRHLHQRSLMSYVIITSY